MVSNSYTDLQYKDATQIAYVKFLNQANENLGPNGNNHYTIEELVRSYVDLDEARRNRELLSPGGKVGKADPIDELKDLIKYSTTIDEGDRDALLNISNDSYNWKFITSRDTNPDTGFYGCCLETTSNPNEKGDLMVAFRGSENMFSSYSNDLHDWVLADLGLIEGKTTLQHHEVDQFTQDLINQGVFDSYSDKEINVAGHSLGGNLAAYFTINAREKYEDVFNRIGLCYNVDGPGFTEEFFMDHEPYVSDACKKIVHYKASFVGNMLKSHVNEDVRYIHVDEDDIDADGIMKYLLRHDTRNWKFNENGSLTFDSEPDATGALFRDISNGIDNMNIESFFFGFSFFAFKWLIGEDMYGSPKVNIFNAVITALGVFALSYASNPFLVTTIIGLISGYVAMALIEKYEVKEKLDEIINSISGDLKSISSKASSMLDQLYNHIVDYISNKNDRFTKAVNYGYSYAVNNPTVKLDTNALRDYARRLDRINQRLSGLNERMKYLYYTIGLIDIIHIINADFAIGYSNTLKRCSNYLSETADDFEQVERNIESAF